MPGARYYQFVRLGKFLCSSIGLKLLMSLTGLGLALFLITHVAANLLVLVDGAKLNAYSHALISNEALLFSAEAGLLGIFLLHIYVAIRLTRMNRAARPIAYASMKDTGRSRRWFGSSNMGITGLLILIFVIYHLIHFKWGTYYTTIQDGVEMRDLSALIREEFHETFEVLLYVGAMIVIAIHLWHGIRSLFDTLGVAKSSWDKLFWALSRAYVILVMGGFTMIPLWIYFLG